MTTLNNLPGAYEAEEVLRYDAYRCLQRVNAYRRKTHYIKEPLRAPTLRGFRVQRFVRRTARIALKASFKRFCDRLAKLAQGQGQ